MSESNLECSANVLLECSLYLKKKNYYFLYIPVVLKAGAHDGRGFRIVRSICLKSGTVVYIFLLWHSTTEIYRVKMILNGCRIL